MTQPVKSKHDETTGQRQMFKLDPSLHYIETAEQNVMEVYRSVSEVKVAPGDHPKEQYEACVCAIKKDSVGMVFVALIQAARKKALIYKVDESVQTEWSSSENLEEALAFAKSMGFTMERVNLNYSRALREVILRNIRIIRLPDKKSVPVEIPAIKVGVETSAAGEAPEKAEEGISPAGAEAEKVPEEKIEAPEPVAKIPEAPSPVKEKPQAEKGAAGQLAEERGKAERLERERILAERAKAEKRAAEQAELARLARQRADTEKDELEKLAVEKAEAERFAQEQAEVSRLAQKKLEEELAERARLLKEKAEAEERALKEAEDARLELERAEAEKAEWERLLAEKEEEERRAREEAEAARRELERLEAERAAQEKLLAEKVDSERRSREEAEGARLALEKAKSEHDERKKLLERKIEAEQRAGEKAAAAGSARLKAEEELAEKERLLQHAKDAEELALKEAEVARTEREKGEAEFSESGKKLEGQVETEKRAAELAEAAHIERKKAEDGLSEKERLVTEQAAVLIQPAQAEEAPGKAEIAVPSATGEEEEGFSWGGEFGQEAPGVTFTLDRSLSSIDFDRDEDVVELYQSLNTARIALEEYHSQDCEAYVCVMKSKGASRVYVALYLSDNKSTLVFSPDRQPETPEECERLIQGAVNFAETVGFMMDLVDLGEKEGRSMALDKIPVLRRTT